MGKTLVATAACVLGLWVLPTTAHAQIVISQVYGGGGNTGATLKNDFIELYNRGGRVVDLAGWSVQYAAAAGTTWQKTDLSGKLEPGQYFLVQEGVGAGGTVNLPTPDASGAIAMSATAGKVALMSNGTLLTVSNPTGGATLVDLVGFGTTANAFEGSGPTPAPSNTAAVLRAGGGCTDANQNATDFVAGTPNPRNRATATAVCAGVLTFSNATPLPAATQSSFYSATFAGTGGSGSGYTFALDSGTLPPGLNLVGATLSGTPNTTIGSPFSFVMRVTDGASAIGTKTFSLVVNPGAVLTLSPTTLPSGTALVFYSQQISVTGGTNCTFGVSGTPAGFSISAPGNTNTGTLSGAAPAGGTFAFTVSASCSNGAGSQAYTLLIGPPQISCGGPKTFIHSIQGSGQASPLAGSAVQVEGIVVGDVQSTTTQLSGFFLQEPDDSWDTDPATSEGIFVFDNNFGVNVNQGDRVRVLGTVSEFNSSGASLTEIGSLQAVQVCSSGNTFQRTLVSLPVANLSDWERYEGMAVRFTQPLTVTGNSDLGGFGSVELAPSRIMQPTQVALPGAPALAQQALNDRSVIVLDDASALANANLYPTLFPTGGLSASNTLRAGSVLAGPLDGVLDHRFGTYRVQATGPVSFLNANPRPAPQPTVGGRIRIGSANLLNFFTTLGGSSTCGPTGTVSCRGASNSSEYARQLSKMVAALVGLNPDLLGVMELENNPTASITAVVDGLNAATAPGTYAYINTGTTGTDSIRNAIIYKPAKLTPVGAFKMLDATIDARVLFGSRPSLAQTFKPASGSKTELQHFTFVVNHFRSKGSSCAADGDPDTGDLQGECNLNRVSLAQALIDWLGGNPTADPTPAADRKILLVGDFNAYLKEDPIRAMMDTSFSKPGFPANARATYRNLIDRISGPNAYSYIFSHQSGYLDHALANPAMDHAVTGLVEWHNNADEPDSLDYNLESKSVAAQTTYFAPDAFRASDHDPIVMGVNLLVGDLDDNGTVDAADQALLRAAFGKAASAADRRMDYDGDGVITLNDYRIWYNYYLAYTR